MSKAILILPEMPESCIKCPACSGYGIAAVCRAHGRYINTYIVGKPDWCKLKPMPEKKTAEWTDYSGDYMFQDYYSLGWNAAIRAIEGRESECL